MSEEKTSEAGSAGSAVGGLAGKLETIKNKRLAEGKAVGEPKVPEPSERLIYLNPDEILIPESLDVRPFSTKAGDTELEQQAIQELAATIEEAGQIQPIKVRRNGDGYELVAGRRRVRAIQLVNAGKAKGEALLLVKAVVDNAKLNDADAYRQAMIENLHRKNLSPFDVLADIKHLRSKFKEKGAAQTKRIAEYLKVSPAQITQFEKLEELTDDVKARVHSGEISKDAAFALAKIDPKKQADVVKKAEEKQKTEADLAKQAEADAKRDIRAASGKTTPAPKTVAAKDTGTVKARHVRAAAREVDPDKPQARTKKEIMEFFDGCQGPAYGYPDGAVHVFVDKLRAFAAGTLTDRTLDKYFYEMVDKAPKGTKASVKE